MNHKPKQNKDNRKNWKEEIRKTMEKISFLDIQNNIIPELLDRDAEKIATIFKGAELTTHQVRRFFDEVKQYQRVIDTGKKSYQDLKPLILMLKSKAKYAENKKKQMSVFYEFIKQSIDQIKKDGNEDKKFEAFCLFFEAVYGFADLRDN